MLLVFLYVTYLKSKLYNYIAAINGHKSQWPWCGCVSRLIEVLNRRISGQHKPVDKVHNGGQWVQYSHVFFTTFQKSGKGL